MDGLHSYLEMVENGREMDQPPTPPEVHEPLVRLVAHAHERSELAVEGAWRLDSRVSRTLERTHESSPPGGWAGLAGLACGCGALRARREAFEPELALVEIAQWDDAMTRRLLLEAFTRLLVPPATAAGLFIVLGLHPAWGLRVAHATHARGRCDFTGEPPVGVEPGWRDESLFSAEIADVVEDAIFSAIASLVAALRKLAPASSYPIDALAGLVNQACCFARKSAQERLDKMENGGLSPFLGERGEHATGRNYRTLDFAAVDLLDSLLVPAGVASRLGDGSFCVFEGALDGVRVGDMDEDAQEVKLTWMLAGEAGCLVA